MILVTRHQNSTQSQKMTITITAIAFHLIYAKANEISQKETMKTLKTLNSCVGQRRKYIYNNNKKKSKFNVI